MCAIRLIGGGFDHQFTLSGYERADDRRTSLPDPQRNAVRVSENKN